jgi:glycine/D-amino acid oxidase-like deaminating enzyme
MQRDYIIVGGGIVGVSVAYGLALLGRKVCVIDAQAQAHKASRGNAGLIWVQGKGQTLPEYAQLSYDSSRLWPDYGRELEQLTGLDLEYQQEGGVDICMTAAEAEQIQQDYQAFYAQQPNLQAHLNWQYLDNRALAEHLPGLGPEVHGGMWSAQDGHCNPLRLLQALYRACHALGVEFQLDAPVSQVTASVSGFTAHTPQAAYNASRIVLAAGLGTVQLAPSLGLSQSVKPIRGQVLITEKRPQLGRLPSPQIRQTGNGSYLIGFSYEDVGFKQHTELQAVALMTDRARRIYPDLADAQLVRSWSALRIMTPDGCPVYEASTEHPGAYGLNCHSGITLSAFHAKGLAQLLDSDQIPDQLASFSGQRFHV